MKCCSLSPRFVHLHFLYLLPSVVKTICSSSIFLQLWSDGTSNIYCIHSIYRQACNFQLNLLRNSYPLLLYSVLSFLSDIIFIILTDSMFFLFFLATTQVIYFSNILCSITTMSLLSICLEPMEMPRKNTYI